MNNEIIKGQHERFVDACNWYTRYLAQQFHASWTSLFQEIWTYPPEGNRTTRAPNEEDLGKFFQCLELISGKLSDKDTALVTIVDDLYNATHLPFIKMGSSGNAGEEEDGYDDVDQERNTGRAGAQQLAFAVIGWISKYFTVVTTCVQQFLTLYRLALSSKAVKTSGNVGVCRDT